MLRALLCALLSLPFAATDANTLYRWTDANGVVHFSDRPAPSNAPVKKTTQIITVDSKDVPYNNTAEERWHGALREHGVQIRTITIKPPTPTHSNPTGR
ncbi:MAG TPA: DUF4124 domain-containing protein [Permianibacter sp.]|nr:DUF4124 domain-containing protein [Permianibacter sp.]